MNYSSDTDLIDGYAKKYLSEKLSGNVYNDGWTITEHGKYSGIIAGRGIIATKDYATGDVIFVDSPLLVSPRVITPAVAGYPVCPVCYTAVTSSTCPGGCMWPVCSQTCADVPEHVDECRYVRKLQPKTTTDDVNSVRNISVGVYNGITPVKGVVSLKNGQYKDFIEILQKKSTNKSVYEVEELKRSVVMKLDNDDEQIMITTCNIMDANCFETITYRHDKLISLRGLYPIASFMNHSCIPNTMHNFNEQLLMTVKASLPIYKGQEITTTYTNLIWPTTLRQNHLLVSKQFICTCTRCCDAEEFGTGLASLNCTTKYCSGRIFPINPLDKMSMWQCNFCTKLVSNIEIVSSYKYIQTLMNSINVFCPKSFETILKTSNIHKDSPYVVDLRLKFIWKSKNNSLNLEQLLYKEELCVEILNLIQKLGLGQCRLLGLISLELLKVIKEKVNRFHWNIKASNIHREEINKLKKICSRVLDVNDNSNV